MVLRLYRYTPYGYTHDYYHKQFSTYNFPVTQITHHIIQDMQKMDE